VLPHDENLPAGLSTSGATRRPDHGVIDRGHPDGSIPPLVRDYPLLLIVLDALAPAPLLLPASGKIRIALSCYVAVTRRFAAFPAVRQRRRRVHDA
jgi:hypothetical protein